MYHHSCGCQYYSFVRTCSHSVKPKPKEREYVVPLIRQNRWILPPKKDGEGSRQGEGKSVEEVALDREAAEAIMKGEVTSNRVSPFLSLYHLQYVCDEDFHTKYLPVSIGLFSFHSSVCLSLHSLVPSSPPQLLSLAVRIMLLYDSCGGGLGMRLVPSSLRPFPPFFFSLFLSLSSSLSLSSFLSFLLSLPPSHLPSLPSYHRHSGGQATRVRATRQWSCGTLDNAEQTASGGGERGG